MVLIYCEVGGGVVRCFVFPERFAGFARTLHPVSVSHNSVTSAVAEPRPRPMRLRYSLGRTYRIIRLLDESCLPGIGRYASFF